MRQVYLITVFVCVLVVSILGFRGSIFTKPPVDVFPEWAFPSMEHQPKPRPQGENKFFADGRADRVPPQHTVARGMLRLDDHKFAGKSGDQFAKGFPASLTVDAQLLKRGHERYDTYCAVCHGQNGDGNGITKRYGMGATPSYHDDRLRTMPEGEIYNTITNGKATMLPYADKLTPDERWAVVAYVRALQRAQQGTAADVTDAAAKQSLGIQ
ncbi:MAG: cytochrome c [Verrucomicrobiota bacterium]